MRALILAAGNQDKWGDAFGIPKHMLQVEGQPLIHRTQHQLAANGVTDITVVAKQGHHAMFTLPGNTATQPAPSPRGWVQEWDGSRHLWATDDRTLIVYGDCYLTDKLAAAMCADPGDPWRVYARFTGSKKTGKRYGEMFGWVFTPDAHAVLDDARAKAIAAVDAGDWWRALGWEVYRIAAGLDFQTYSGREKTHAKHWSDESDDFDTPDEWATWSRLNPHLA